MPRLVPESLPAALSQALDQMETIKLLAEKRKKSKNEILDNLSEYQCPVKSGVISSPTLPKFLKRINVHNNIESA